ncbi:MAG: hypothetical protein V3T56_00795 [Gemmatimonadales bacterium]
MVPGQALTVTQLEVASTAELTPIPVASEEEGVGNLPAELPWHVHKPTETNDRGSGNRNVGTTKYAVTVRLDDLSLAIDNEAEGASNGNERERLEGCV